MGKIALIDADGLIYINCHNKKDAPIKTLEDCKRSVDNMIQQILISSKANEYLLFLTVGKNFRYSIYPEYKANRKYGDKPEHFDRIKEYLITDYKSIYGYNLEADDLINIYKNKLDDSFICSSDKDLLMLEGDCYNYKTHKWTKTTKDVASYNFWFSMITGDTVDNIKGIPGKGPKYAERLHSVCKKEDEEISYQMFVLNEYIIHFGEQLGIEEFYKNYKCLKIVDEQEGIEINTPLKFNLFSNEFAEGDK